jgi:N-methylhydantoinase A
MSELSAEYAQMAFTTSGDFATEAVNRVLADLEARCQAFIAGPGENSLEQRIEYAVEARYPHQIWEIEVPLRAGRFGAAADVRQLVADFHQAHKDVFEISDPNSEIELVTWRARVRCRLREQEAGRLVAATTDVEVEGTRRVYFSEEGWVEAAVRRFESLPEGEAVEGPAIIESSFTTVVIDPGATARRTASGSVSVAT